MSDLTRNSSTFNLPTYINIPFFLYQDTRLEKSATIIAAFFYSLHTSGLTITASCEYLCAIAGINKRQFYKIMNQIESIGYIKRIGFTNRKKIHWIYAPKSSITIVERDTTALECTNVQELHTSALKDTKLVHSSALNYCTPVHTDNKEDTKDYKTTTTVQNLPVPAPSAPSTSSSSFFSEKQTQDLLSYKLPTDVRSNELFLENCVHHVEKQVNDLSKYQRFTGLKHILTKQYELRDHFKATGFEESISKTATIHRIPTKEDIENYRNCVDGSEWVSAHVIRK